MSSNHHSIVIMTPAPGKADRVKEIMFKNAKLVLEKEPAALKYEVFEQVDSEGVSVIVLEETYETDAGFDAHIKTDYFLDTVKIGMEEGLLAVPMDVKVLKSFAGFSSR
ncbi:hypothetical protein V1525DRAFT_415218 [Lipomyces kononenkoae]|uniref:Uncharacterized protein n=1 Tax=Lipomyces kononenkoae TaxID=34357 RepID=A0ACC3SQA1_LIPKO